MALDERLRNMSPAGWFAGQPAALRQQLLSNAVEVRFADGDWIYGATEKAGGFFCVLEGTIRLYAALNRGETILIDIVGAGTWFGHAGVMRNGQRLVTAIAAGPVKALLISRQSVIDLLRRNPGLVESFMQLDVVHFQYLTQVLSELLALAPRERIAARLCSLTNHVALAGGVWRIAVTQADLAEMVGVERKTVNRVLADFEERGHIKRSYRSIEIHDLSALTQIRDILID